jgi:hypothetical protein
MTKIKKTDNTMAKRKRTKEHIIIHKSLHKANNEQQNLTKNW